MAERINEIYSDCYNDYEGRRKVKWKTWNWETFGKKDMIDTQLNQRNVDAIYLRMLGYDRMEYLKLVDSAPTVANQILFEAYISSYRKVIVEFSNIESFEKKFVQKHNEFIKSLAINNKFIMGQSDGICNLVKSMLSISNLRQESEKLFDALINVYSIHCDQPIIRKYAQMLPQIVSSIDSNDTKTNYLINLKYFMYFYKGLLTYGSNKDVGCWYECDHFEINTNDKLKRNDLCQNKSRFIRSMGLSFKNHALLIKAILKLTKDDLKYSCLLSIKDNKYCIDIVFSHLRNETNIEYIKCDKRRILLISLSSSDLLDNNWICFKMVAIRTDDFRVYINDEQITVQKPIK